MEDGSHRPAIVVRVWRVPTYEKLPDGSYRLDDRDQYVQIGSEPPANGCVNLHVFPDYENDGKQFAKGPFWATSILYSEQPNARTWHWIERA